MWLGTLLMERSEDIYRMKGLLSVQGMDERFVFQVSQKVRERLLFFIIGAQLILFCTLIS